MAEGPSSIKVRFFSTIFVNFSFLCKYEIKCCSVVEKEKRKKKYVFTENTDGKFGNRSTYMQYRVSA